MRTVRCRPASALVVTAVLLLGACSDNGESSAPAPAPATTTTIAQAELDEQKAPRVVLTAADLPGFTQDPPESDEEESSPDLEEAATACFNNDPLLLRLGEDDDPRGASSPDFSRGETTTVSSAVTFGESEDEARASMAALDASSFPGCFSNALRVALREEDAATFGNATVNTARLPATTAGDQTLGYRSTIRTTVRGQTITFYVDFSFTRSGRGLSVLTLFNIGTPFADAERTRLVTLVAGRMAAP
jgi:hypothetical protein